MLTCVKRDGTVTKYDESKICQAMIQAGVEPEIAAKLAADVTRMARPPLNVTILGNLTEETMMRAGLYNACRRYIEYRASRRVERQKRATITGGIDESLKHIKASTLSMLRGAATNPASIRTAIERIEPDCSDLVLSGRFIPDDVIIMEGRYNGPYRVTIPAMIQEQLHVLTYTNKFALYVNWNDSPDSFRNVFEMACLYTGCLIREGRFGGMLDMSKIPLPELAETALRAARFLESWEGASGPGVIIPPGMDHHVIHRIITKVIPNWVPTAIYGKQDDIWEDTPYRGGCPSCGGVLIRTESCMSCSCGWSACST